MKYMLMIADTKGWDELDPDEQGGLMGRIFAWWEVHSASGEVIEGHQLQAVDTATTVRRSPDGNVTVTDGPFIESKESLGGYAIIDVPDLDAAIRLASSWPAPDALEIRPIVVRER